MIEKIDRYYLEILSIQSLKHKKKPNENLRIELLKKENFDFIKKASEDCPVTRNLSESLDLKINWHHQNTSQKIIFN